jgi:hypothetical protein
VPVNVGKHMHEMVLGTMQELQDHYEMMKTNPHMPHDEAHMAHVARESQGSWSGNSPSQESSISAADRRPPRCRDDGQGAGARSVRIRGLGSPATKGNRPAKLASYGVR